MLSSRLFWKLLLTCAGVNLIAAVLCGWVLSAWLQDQVIQQIDHRLQNASRLVSGELAPLIGSGPSETLQKRLRELDQQTNTRFTLLAADGAVIADSERVTLAEVLAMDNHRDRPEIVRARGRGTGESTHISHTFGTPHRYSALRIDVAGQPVGFIRASLPVAAIDAQTADVRRWIWALVAVEFVIAVAISWWIISRILRPVPALAEAAEAIVAGDYKHRVYIGNHDEFGALGRTLNRLSQELDDRMSLVNQSGDRQSTVLGGMIEGVIAVDDRQRIVLANEAAGRLFAFRPPAAEGRPLLEVVRNHALSTAVKNALSSGQSQRLETRSHIQNPASTTQHPASDIQHPASNIQHIDIHVQPLPGNPCPGVVLVMHDTTELRRLESLRRDFVANVSHELKTPLSSIRAYAETLRNGALHDPEAGQRFLARIEEQSDRLHHLILDLLMIARIESDQQAFEIGNIDVAEVVAACVEGHRQAAAAKGIALIVNAPSKPCRVRADREGLREILDNLVDNAIKYTPAGGSVTIAWRSNDQAPAPSPQSPAVLISVTDTGIGIKPDDQRRVFERFYRVDKARSRELGGTGLGLAIVKHLAQAFGGSVAVESNVGQGSMFTVELPVG
jgi:two-component system phosphate regulon sensor histidine kinase PhoR